MFTFCMYFACCVIIVCSKKIVKVTTVTFMQIPDSEVKKLMNHYEVELTYSFLWLLY